MQDYRAPTVSFILAALSYAVSRRMLTRTAVKLEVEGDTLHVTTLALFGHLHKEYPLADVEGAHPNTLTTNFVAKTPTGWERTYYLFPDEWASQDKVPLLP